MGDIEPTNMQEPLHAPTLADLQASVAHFRAALTSLGLFFAAANEADPLPLLANLSRDLLRADDLELTVPAVPNSATPTDAHVLTRAITIGGRRVGLLEAHRARPFNDDDAALATLASKVISVVLEHSALYSQFDQYRRQVEAQEATLNRLLEFNRRIISGDSDQQQLALLLATQVPAMVGGERASLLLTLPDQPDTPQLVLSNGTIASVERARQVRSSGLAGLVLRERRPLILDETETDHRWLALDMVEYEDRTRCAMAVPLLWHQHLLGALTVTTAESHRFGSSQLDLLELMACQVVLILRCAMLETRLNTVASTLGNLLHDLNDPLQAAQLSIQMLMPVPDDTVEVRVDSDDLAKIAAALERIGDVGRQLALVQRSLLMILETRPVDSANEL